MSDEKKSTGSHLILSFYNEVEMLIANEAQYNNVILEFITKYNLESGNAEDIRRNLEAINENEKTVLINQLQNVRYYVLKVYKKYIAISLKLDLGKDKEIKACYDKIMSSYIIVRSDLDQFTTLLSEVIVSDVIGTLLTNSQEFLKDVLQDGSPQ